MAVRIFSFYPFCRFSTCHTSKSIIPRKLKLIDTLSSLSGDLKSHGGKEPKFKKISAKDTLEKINKTLAEMENILKEMLEGFKRKEVRRLKEQHEREKKERKKKETSFEGLIKAKF